MALSPLPASNTKRYFLGNQAGDLTHTIQIRTDGTQTDAQVVTALTSIFSVILPVCFDDTSFGPLEVADLGSDIRNPVAGWSTLVGTQPGSQPANDDPLTLCARGRSSDGRKVRLFLWGVLFTRPDTWRFVPGSATDLESFLSSLNSAAHTFFAIGGLKPVWRSDYTVNYNDHAIKRLRP